LPVISVSIKPGAIALERMPREPSSSATDLVKPMMPALEARSLAWPALPFIPTHGGHINNRALFLLHHLLGGSFHGVEAGLEVYGNDLVPHFLVHAEQQGVLGNAGVVDEHVQRAEVGNDVVDQFFGLGEVGGIGAVAFRFYAFVGELSFQGLALVLRWRGR